MRTHPCECEIMGEPCSVFRGHWTAPEPLRSMLQTDEDYSRRFGLRPPEGDADFASASLAVAAHGGRILSSPEPESEPGRVY